VITQTLALLGAAISGVSSRKKRLELAALNEKLRKMNRKDEDSACRYDWDNVEGQCTDRWPGAEALSNGTEALKSGNTEEALEAFQTARAQCEDGEVRFEVRSLTGIKAAAYLAATKGYAACLISFGGERNLKTAVVALKAVEVLAERAGDETVFGTVADALTDLGDFGQAGTYYDKVLAMD
jgi:tetratricopeptide (TPR) repeat protein